ncbi:MAG: hypothetical protein AB7T06_39505 [Kofleriaceae bacterium]
MAATTPDLRTGAPISGIAISESVRALHYVEASRLQNWCAGRAMKIVPCHNPAATVGSGNTATFTYRVLPRFQDLRYALTIVLSAASVTEASVTFGSSTYRYFTRTPGLTDPVTLFADRAGQADTETDLTFTVSSISEEITVDSVLIEAVPRALLSTSNADYGTDRYDFWPRSPIFEGNISDTIVDAQNDLRQACRRGQFQHSFGSDAPWSTTSGTPVSIFAGGGVDLLGRFLFNGETTRTMNWRVRGYCSDGTTKADITIANLSAGTTVSTVSIGTGSTSAAWFPTTAGAAASFSCDAENVAAATGLRRAGGDLHDIKVVRAGGSGTVYIESISIWEPAT